MTQTAYLIPKAGLRMRDPQTLQLLPEEGDTLPLTSYWRRRINEGDVSIGTPPRAAGAKPDKSIKPAAARGAQE